MDQPKGKVVAKIAGSHAKDFYTFPSPAVDATRGEFIRRVSWRRYRASSIAEGGGGAVGERDDRDREGRRLEEPEDFLE